MKADHFLNRNLVHTYSQTPVREVIKLMIEKNVSSVLIHDDHEKVVGIFTERDVVRKFTLLDKEDKLDALINTVMSRPVIYADSNRLEASIKDLYKTHGYRHFPVRSGNSDDFHDVLGILTVTDFLHIGDASLKDEQGESAAKKRNQLVVVCGDDEALKTYEKLLKFYDIEIVKPLAPSQEAISELIANAINENVFIFYDMDFFSVEQNIKWTQSLKKARLFLTTSEEKIVSPYRSIFNQADQHIFLKPIDISYLAWLLQKTNS